MVDIFFLFFCQGDAEFQGAFQVCVDDGCAVGDSFAGAYLDPGDDSVGFWVNTAAGALDFLVFFQLFLEDGQFQAVDGQAVVGGGRVPRIIQAAFGIQEGVVPAFPCV